MTDDKENYNATLQMFLQLIRSVFPDPCVSGSCIRSYAAFGWSGTGRNGSWNSSWNVFVSPAYYDRNQKSGIYFYDVCRKLSPFILNLFAETIGRLHIV